MGWPAWARHGAAIIIAALLCTLLVCLVADVSQREDDADEDDACAVLCSWEKERGVMLGGECRCGGTL